MRIHVLIGYGFLALVVLAVCWVAAHVFWSPHVAIQCSTDPQGRLVFDLKPNWRVNGIMKIDCWAEGDSEVRWTLGSAIGRDEPFRRAVYGQVTYGREQRYPENNLAPRPLPKGKRVFARVRYRWDITIPPAASSGTSTVAFQITDDGTIEYVTDLGEAGFYEGLTDEWFE